eukprot:gene13246-13354_t
MNLPKALMSLELPLTPITMTIVMTAWNIMIDIFFFQSLLAGIGLSFITSPIGCVALGLIFNMNIHFGILLVCLMVTFILAFVDDRVDLPSDTWLSITSYSALALGIVFMNKASVRVDPSSYLFGDILTLQNQDFIWIFGCALLVGFFTYWQWQPLLLCTLDAGLAQAEGVPSTRLKLGFMLVLALTVAVSLKFIGVLLVPALLVIPPATAKGYAKTPEQMVLYALLFTLVGIIGGLFISLAFNLATGRTQDINEEAMIAAYVSARMPATYAAMDMCFQMIKNVFPTSILDLGAGPGTATLAALNLWPKLKIAILVEHHAAMSRFSKEYDLVTLGYVLGELNQEQQLAALKKAWDATKEFLVITMPGTPHDYQTLMRVKNLEDQNIIQSYHANLNAGALGFGVIIFAEVALSSQNDADLRVFEEQVQKWPMVRECYMVTGGSDFLLKIVAKDFDAYQSFLSAELSTMVKVAQIKTRMVIRAAKKLPGVPLEQVQI